MDVVAVAVDVVAAAVDVDAVAAVYKTSPSARKQGERRKIKIVVSAQEKNKLPLKKIHPMGLFLYLPLLSLPLTPFSLPLSQTQEMYSRGDFWLELIARIWFGMVCISQTMGVNFKQTKNL